MSVRTRLRENVPLLLGTLILLGTGVIRGLSPADIAVAWCLAVLVSVWVDWVLEPLGGDR
jgi:hypothetical protein